MKTRTTCQKRMHKRFKRRERRAKRMEGSFSRVTTISFVTSSKS